MGQGVVPGAENLGVREAGGPAVSPRLLVVDVAPRGWYLAGRVLTRSTFDHERESLGGSVEPGLASQIQHLGPPAQDSGDDAGLERLDGAAVPRTGGVAATLVVTIDHRSLAGELHRAGTLGTPESLIGQHSPGGERPATRATGPVQSHPGPSPSPPAVPDESRAPTTQPSRPPPTRPPPRLRPRARATATPRPLPGPAPASGTSAPPSSRRLPCSRPAHRLPPTTLAPASPRTPPPGASRVRPALLSCGLVKPSAPTFTAAIPMSTCKRSRQSHDRRPPSGASCSASPQLLVQHPGRSAAASLWSSGRLSGGSDDDHRLTVAAHCSSHGSTRRCTGPRRPSRRLQRRSRAPRRRPDPVCHAEHVRPGHHRSPGRRDAGGVRPPLAGGGRPSPDNWRCRIPTIDQPYVPALR